MRICVVGSGYVGLVAGACFADLGHEVILVDNDAQKLADLQSGRVPIHEKFLPELLTRHRGQRLNFSGNLADAVRASSAIFIAVGTPPTNAGEADLSYVESVAREVACAINGYKVVVEKSTVPVYTSNWVRIVMLRNGAEPDSFDVASNSEFLREGTAVTDFLYPDRIVFGADHECCAAPRDLRSLYWWQLLQQPGRGSCATECQNSSSGHCYQRQERGTDQACLQCFSGHEDLICERGCFDLRVGRRRRSPGLSRNRFRLAHRTALS